MSDPIQQSQEQVIEKFLLMDTAKRAQVSLAIYALAPDFAAELHNLSILHTFEVSGREAPPGKGAPKARPQTSDPLLRSHRATSQL